MGGRCMDWVLHVGWEILGITRILWAVCSTFSDFVVWKDVGSLSGVVIIDTLHLWSSVLDGYP